MSKKFAFLFPGQGAQEPGMLKEICEAFPEARKVVDEVSRISGLDMTKVMWESEKEVLSRSDNSQMAILTASLATMKVLETKGITPSASMGFSLGEFPALYAAGVLSFEDVVKVVRVRGQIMQKVCEDIAAANAGHAPGMTAVIGLSQDQVKDLCAGIKDAYPANLNSVVQTVVSGTFDALTEVEAKAKEAGARRALRLAVAGPFHSPLMQKAAEEFEKAIADVTFNDSKIELFSNVTGKKATSGAEIKKNAVLHLTNPVHWTEEEDVLAGVMDADWQVLEVGPGKVLSGLFAKTPYAEKWTVSPINTVEGINNL